jgi:uncharacterized cupredoxin-like copper-binding protein
MRFGSRLARWGLVAAALSLAFTFIGCDGDEATTIDVTLQEWAVVPAEDSAPAGEVTFAISNTGEETHEFVVMATDSGAGELPTNEEGSVDEEGGDIEVIDEFEDLPSGESTELTMDLDTGHYVLLCNIVEEENGEVESHYQMGMRIDFTVD